MSPIPTLNLKEHSLEVQASLMRHALSSVGFFAVEGTDLPVPLIRQMFSSSADFFTLPEEEKDKYAQTSRDASGYLRYKQQSLVDGKNDHKESWAWGMNTATVDQPLPPPWNTSEEKRAVVQDFYSQCWQVSQHLMGLFALALGLPMDHFRQCHSPGKKSIFTSIKYPALSSAQKASLTDVDIRAGDHKDWGTLTLLFQEPNGTPGLQAYLPASLDPETPLAAGYRWYDAPIPAEGGFLVNVGMAMEYWSSGEYQATIHRVIFPATQDDECGARQSIAFFVTPDPETELLPIKGDKAAEQSAKAITAGELYDQYNLASLARQRQQVVA